MKDPKADFEKAMASLAEGKRGLGAAPPDNTSRFVGKCLLALGPLFHEAVRMKAVPAFGDVLAWQLAMIGTQGGPSAVASVVGLLDWHLGQMTAEAIDEGGQGAAAHPLPIRAGSAASRVRGGDDPRRLRPQGADRQPDLAPLRVPRAGRLAQRRSPRSPFAGVFPFPVVRIVWRPSPSGYGPGMTVAALPIP